MDNYFTKHKTLIISYIILAASIIFCTYQFIKLPIARKIPIVDKYIKNLQIRKFQKSIPQSSPSGITSEVLKNMDENENKTMIIDPQKEGLLPILPK